jgi:hypothetical protein
MGPACVMPIGSAFINIIMMALQHGFEVSTTTKEVKEAHRVAISFGSVKGE